MRERAKHDATSLVWGGAPTVVTCVSRLADWYPPTGARSDRQELFAFVQETRICLPFERAPGLPGCAAWRST